MESKESKVIVHRLGVLSFSGYAKYIQEVKKEKIYKLEPIREIPDYCGTKVNVLIWQKF